MENTKDIQMALGISENASKIYLGALEKGSATLSELATRADISRTVVAKPLRELLDLGLLTKQVRGKRTFYYPLSPQNWDSVFIKRERAAKEISQTLLQQLTSVESDLQIRWFNGTAGIQSAFLEILAKGKGKRWREFENAKAYDFVPLNFLKYAVAHRVKMGIHNRVIAIGAEDSRGWYKEMLKRNKEELREVIMISASEYPFQANILVSDNLILIYEYLHKPFALLIDNDVLAQSIRSIHDMIWDRYRAVQ